MDWALLHRDLSPCNILVSASGAVKVSDLGIAKVMEQGQAHTHTFRGKPRYASPEALQCARLDARSDLYSLGTILYELLTGTAPYGEELELVKILARMMDEDVPPLPPETPQDLAELAMGLLWTDPAARRPQSAAEALALLRSRGEPVASKAELAALLAAARAQRDGASARAGSVQVLAPGDVLAPRASPAQSESLDSAVPVAPQSPKRVTAPFVDAWRGSLALTRTMLGAGRRVAMHALRIALLIACGAVLGFLLQLCYRIFSDIFESFFDNPVASSLVYLRHEIKGIRCRASKQKRTSQKETILQNRWFETSKYKFTISECTHRKFIAVKVKCFVNKFPFFKFHCRFSSFWRLV